MTYSVKEIFYTLQGEGANSGTPAVFCRLSGCNLWSGLQRDRSRAVCRFCDTEFVGTDGQGGGKFLSAEQLAGRLIREWPSGYPKRRFVVLTGGEPALQVDKELVDALHLRDFQIAIETNGTLPLPPGIDWICVSPKAGTTLSIVAGDELKLVYPQNGAEPHKYEALQFRHFFLQPMDGPSGKTNTDLAVDYCKAHPNWRLSIQSHKVIGIP
jgi:7-carboxy-7-deazaguanine synthase (Cx14CxxC type)